MPTWRGFVMLGLLFLGGVFVAFSILWNEPRWSIYLVSSVLIGGIVGVLAWAMLGDLGDAPQPIVDRFAALAAPFILLFLMYAVGGLAIVIFRGAYLRWKKKRDDAEMEAELARIRKSN